MFVGKKKKEVKITDMAIPGDARVKDKEVEKLEKYQLVKEEIGKLWEMGKADGGTRGDWSTRGSFKRV